jgi:hypothetical protein
MVALGDGRDPIVIDLDSRNADFALEPVGMWLTVEDPPNLTAWSGPQFRVG